MVARDFTATDKVEEKVPEGPVPDRGSMPAVSVDAPEVKRSWRGRLRRTWPQRILIGLGLAVAAGCFATAFVFWRANIVLSEIPRISVGPDVLAATGDPGSPVNVLLVGIDSSEGLDVDDPVRVGREVEDEARGVVRPDTILVVRLDPAIGSATVLSLPRDLIVELDGGSTTRLNATQTVGGIGALIEAIDQNLGVPVNHFAMVDFAGFSEIVDLVGGVPVYFPFPTRDSGSGLSVPDAGCYNLNGSQSLSYVRARSIEEFVNEEWVPLFAASPDLARIERQQQFLVLTAEQVLGVARRDVSRINGFVTAGTQAVQLDEELTPGDIADLASAFSDFDTDELNVSTLPVAPSFSESNVYLGEQLVVEEAQDVLAFFGGVTAVVRPDDVSIAITSDTDRHAIEFGERGFNAETTNGELSVRSSLQFDPETSFDEAMLVARYLETPPQLLAEAGAALMLNVGPDFAGVRVFPRPESDVAPLFAAAIAGLGEDLETGETSVAGFAADETDPLLSPEEAIPGTTAVEPELNPSPLSTAVRGRPPEGVGCTVLGG